MLSMLLDASGKSSIAFTRECGSVIVGGLRERTAITAQARRRRLIADSFCRAAVIWVAFLAWSTLSIEAHADGDAWDIAVSVVVWAALASALVGYDQRAGVLGVCLIAASIAFDLAKHVNAPTGAVPWTVARISVPLICLAVLACAPRKRPRDTRRLLWLIPIAALGAITSPLRLIDGLPPEELFLSALSVCGLIRLAADPRLAIACGLIWSSMLVSGLVLRAVTGGTIYNPEWLLAIVATPAILVVGAVRLGFMRRDV